MSVLDEQRRVAQAEAKVYDILPFWFEMWRLPYVYGWWLAKQWTLSR